MQGLLTLAVSVVFIGSLYLAREVLVPITLAVLLSFVLAPLAGLLRRIHFPRLLSVIVAVILAMGIILALGGLIGLQLAQLGADLPRYASVVEGKVDTLRGATLGRVSEVMGRLGRQYEVAPQPAPKAAPQNRPTTPAPLPVEVREPAPTPVELIERIAAPVLGPLGTLGIVLVVAVFILLQREDLRDRLIRLFGSGDLHRTTAALDDAGRRLSKYFLAQLALNAAFGLIIGGGLFLIGVPSPLLWGICAALFRFVPYIGSFIAAVFPIALAAGVDPGWSMVLETFALFLVAEPVMGQVVEPLTYGHSTGLSPISVVVAAIFWTWLWGPIGLILSMPLTLCLVVMGRHVKRLEFIDVLLGDRPALTPIESFYQRMLAGDPDEAQVYAETLLKGRSLSSYYDEVAIPGLQLAAGDAERGSLLPPQITRIGGTIGELIEELAEHEDVEPVPLPADDSAIGPPEHEPDRPRPPPPHGVARDSLSPRWQSETAVLCIAGRGPLDAAPSEMLAQLLAKHGLAARVAPHEVVGRTGIAGLPVEGVAMVCMTYLDLGTAPASIRYAVRRLRQRLPGVAILVGLWPPDMPADEMLRIQAAIGADFYPSSLREAVEACSRQAQKPEDARPSPGVTSPPAASPAAPLSVPLGAAHAPG